MKIKTATLLGMIGAIVSICVTLFYLLVNSGIVEYVPAISIVTNIISIFTSGTLVIFFYTLYKNQK